MISKFLAFVVVILVVSLVFLNFAFLPETRSEFPDFFVGVSAAYADVDAIKVLIDEVSSYTNIFVIGSDGVSTFEDKLNEVCQYLVDKGMYFIVFADIHFQLEVIKEIENSIENAKMELETFVNNVKSKPLEHARPPPSLYRREEEDL